MQMHIRPIRASLHFLIVVLSYVGLSAQSFPTPTGFTIPAGKSVTIVYEVDVNVCPAGVAPALLSNQSSVSGGNFTTVLTDDPDIGGSSDPTVTPYSALTIGNLVFEDLNGNGLFDMGDVGIDDVVVNLYLDANTNNVLDAGDGMAIATTTTSTIMTQAGTYFFSVCPGTYIIEIAASNFLLGGALNNAGSPYASSPAGPAPDPDVDGTDNDDNGNDAMSPFGVASSAFSVSADNQTIDFSFIKGTFVSIGDVTINEGSSSGVTTFSFVVTRSKNDETFNLTVNTVDGSAKTVDGDYVGIVGGTVSFTMGGSLTAMVDVMVNKDAIVEDDETLTVVLSGASPGVILADDTGLGTITNDDAAMLTLSGGTAKSEGNMGMTSFTFTATLNEAVQSGFDVAFTTGGGTSMAGSDYTINDGTLSFNGTASEQKSWTVLVNGDNLVELDETFEGVLGALSMTSIVQGNAISVDNSPQTSTILNDDAAVVALASDVSQLEAITPQTFSMTLSNPVDINVTLDFSTSDNIAMTNDLDYSGITNQMVTFPAGMTTAQTVDVTVIDDSKVEAEETFNVQLSNLGAGSRDVIFMGGGVTFAGTGTIENDDMATVTLTAPTPADEGNSGNTPFVFTATLDNPVQGGFTVSFNVQDGTATDADDFDVLTASPLTFSGTMNEMQTITVNVNGDHKVEADEDFTGALGTPSVANVSVTGTPIAMILNDEIDFGDLPDPNYPTLLSNNGARHMTTLGFQLGASIDGDSDGQPDAASTGDDTDIEGDDEDGVIIPTLLLSQNAMIIVNASMAGKLDAWIDYNGDGSFAQAGEQIATNLSLMAGNNILNTMVPGGANLGTSFARFRFSTAGTLSFDGLAADGEVEDYQVNIANTQFSIDDPMVDEGNSSTTDLVFTVSRNTSGGTNSVMYAITGGTATAGDNDYQLLGTGTLNFMGSDLSQTIVLNVNGDTKVELDESVEITLSNPINASILDGHGNGIIKNDDAAIITVNSPSKIEGNGGTSMLTFNVSLSQPSDAAVTFDYITMDGTAENENGDGDYISKNGILTFIAGQTRKEVDVIINGDCTIEPSESFAMVLSNLMVNSRQISLTGGAPTLTGTGTITNDDSTPGLTCPADLLKQVTCGATSTSVTLPLPNATGICQTPVMEFRYRTVNASNVPIGSFTSYFPSLANTKIFSLGRYEIQWRVTGGNGSISCSHYLQVNAITATVAQISGPATICPNINNIPYSITPQPGITNYQWSYSGTGVVIHNNGSANISIDFSSSATAGQLSVQVVNPCGGANATSNLNIQMGSLQNCFYVNCLINNLFVSDNTLLLPGMPQIFKVGGNITSNATIKSPKTVLFKAGNNINLDPGFKVHSGAVFVSEIEGCPIVLPFNAKN